MLKIDRLGSTIFVFAGNDYAVHHCNNRMTAIIKTTLLQLILNK
ncbi:hypothetical protein LROSL3_2050 [Furfurilactobacillus rossiae]|nr:hypothetical protein LROSL2_2049 [Furfurilactobacillus rossiae]QLE69829.1 hypothetical protein LROSL3_2050 [Furfurilactobacillus rossiae]